MEEDRRKLVLERIQLVNQLTNVKNHFKGRHLTEKTGKNTVTHPYKHYFALRNYLLLTCFDILGQPSDWLDFKSWLISKRKSDERKVVLENIQTVNKVDITKSIYEEYLKIYGVKNSFYRFIREIISAKNRSNLFKSISANRITSEAEEFEDGTHTTRGAENYKISDQQKEKFLFNFRNSFTHKGVSFGHAGAGIVSEPFDLEGPQLYDKNEGPFYLALSVHEEKINGEIIVYKVSKWPELLIEIIESEIKNS